MSLSSRRQSMLSYLVDLAVQLQRDADRTDVELHRRDRALTADLGVESGDRPTVLRKWIDALHSEGESLPGRAIGIGYRVAVLALVVVGLTIGWGVAALVFEYDGSRPVNVVNVLAVFVAAQLFLLVLLSLVMLPHRLAGRIPGAAAVQEALGWLSPGQLTRLVVRRLPVTMRDSLATALGRGAAHGRHFGAVQKWAVIFPAQAFAAAFNLGALVGCLYLITFSDLAFSWSTTLNPDVERAHRVTSALSRPWARLVPEAVPSADLIQETLYYRQSGMTSERDPIRWGGWWPFLVACMVTYGVLPRVLLLFLSWWRLSSSVRHAFVEAPGVRVVLDRLVSEMVTTQAISPEPAASEPPVNAGGIDCAASIAAPQLCLINWGGLEVADDALQRQVNTAWNKRIVSVHHAGGRALIEDDARTIAAIAATPTETSVALFVKAWEPPVLELLDFLEDLRRVVGSRRVVVVTPVGLGGQGRFVAPEESDVVQWGRRVRGLGDAALVVRPWQKGGAS